MSRSVVNELGYPQVNVTTPPPLTLAVLLCDAHVTFQISEMDFAKGSSDPEKAAERMAGGENSRSFMLMLMLVKLYTSSTWNSV